MTQYTRPATIEDVKLLIAALNAQGADYLLIGGYALFAHGYHRATEDIDLLICVKKTPWIAPSSNVRWKLRGKIHKNNSGHHYYRLDVVAGTNWGG